jgi:hypothetical protein
MQKSIKNSLAWNCSPRSSWCALEIPPNPKGDVNNRSTHCEFLLPGIQVLLMGTHTMKDTNKSEVHLPGTAARGLPGARRVRSGRPAAKWRRLGAQPSAPGRARSGSCPPPASAAGRSAPVRINRHYIIIARFPCQNRHGMRHADRL